MGFLNESKSTAMIPRRASYDNELGCRCAACQQEEDSNGEEEESKLTAETIVDS